MTIINPNSIAGITSVTAEAGVMNFYKSDGTLAGLQLNGVNFNTTSGISTFNNVYVGGTITYEDVKNVDSVGIITARTGIKVLAGGIDVTGNSEFSAVVDVAGDLAIADTIRHIGDSNTKIRFPSNDTVSVETAGSERLRIRSDGTVDIGSGTHSRNLTVHAATNSVILIEGASNGTSNLMFGDENDEDVGMLGYNHASNYLAFTVNTAERLRITSAGQLKISGTASNDPLLVIGGTESNASIRLEGGASGADNSRIESKYNLALACNGDGNQSSRDIRFYNNTTMLMNLTSAGYLGVNNTSPSTRLDVKQDNGVAYNGNAQTIAYNAARFHNTSGHTSGGTYTGFQFNITGDSQNRICSIGMISQASNSKASSLVFHTDDGGNRTEKLRIDSSGRLLIGSTKTYSDATWYDDITINNSGGSGQTGGTGITLISASNSWGSILFGDGDDNNIGAIKYDHNTNSLRFVVNTTDPAVLITSAGNVGIGDASPGQKLNVKNAAACIVQAQSTNSNTSAIFQCVGKNSSGTARTAKFCYDNADEVRIITDSAIPIKFMVSNAEKMRVHSDGKIGINNNSPDRTLNITSVTGGNCDVELKSANNTGWCQLIFSDTDAAYRGAIGYSHTNDFMALYTAGTERLRIHNTGVVQVQDSTNSTQGGAQLLVRKGAGSNAAPDTINRANSYLHLGGTEWGQSADGVYTLSFGYTNGTTGVYVPAYVGFKETSTSSYTMGDLVFGVKNGAGDQAPAERLRITSAGKIGVNNTEPAGRTGSIDISSNDGSSGRVFTDQRHNSMLTLRNPSTTQHAYTQLAFINGGGNQSATLLRHFKGGAKSNNNYEGDLRLYRRVAGNGGANNDFRESTAWCGLNEGSRQIWWAQGAGDTSNTERLGWHHLSGQQDTGSDQYMYFRAEIGAASYSRPGMGKYTVVWTTGHASGYGYQMGYFGWYNHHSNSRIYVNDHIVQRNRASNGSYYGWSNWPTMEIMNYTQSGGTNAGIVFRCEGNRSSGYDMSIRLGFFLDLYVPESSNGDSTPRLYNAGNSHSNLDGAVARDFVTFQSTNPNQTGQP